MATENIEHRQTIAQIVRNRLRQAFEVLEQYPDIKIIGQYYRGLDTDDEVFKEAALTILNAVYPDPEYPDFCHKSVQWLKEQASHKIKDIDMRESIAKKIQEMSADGKIIILQTGDVNHASLINADVLDYLNMCDWLKEKSHGKYTITIENPLRYQNQIKQQKMLERSEQIRGQYLWSKGNQSDKDAALNRIKTECDGYFLDDETALNFITAADEPDYPIPKF